ncbi:uncharacterized protein N7482_008187 [Penicillium canariense]|uniref:Uncharacterized protein n=1 Tax=Penicillium canariense TaxID=189055 RepID=A0A9W9HVA2_9EURO|nr:uncharacterized protein N7482_008187 [Penicillium canariense]KAJ5157087.1 hypothetical protein N7482_008187 [Penicillium canariense]
MRKPSLAQTVHDTLFPRARSSDPVSFAAHITRNLVPEVRIETNAFYGPLDCIEAQYPGLDYAYQPHRVRLGRFQWHRRLFRAFDELRLTEDEISELCCWEGTKSARRRYELEEGITVRDTTGDDIRIATPPPLPSVTIHPDFFTLTESWEEEDYDMAAETRSDDTVRASGSRSSSVLSDFRSPLGDDEYSDEEVESCGVALNHRLLAATAARAQGADVPLDEDYEQWLKEANERGGYNWMVEAIRANQPLGFPEATVSSPPSPITDAFGARTRSMQVEVIRTHEISRARNTAYYPDPPDTTEYLVAPRHYLNWGELLSEDDLDHVFTPPPQAPRTSNTAR